MRMLVLLDQGQQAMVDQRSVLGRASLLWCLVLFESALGQRTEALSSVSERVTLLSLRSSLGLRTCDWPIKGNPCLDWNGIRCENESVVVINISGFKRTRIGKQNPKFAVDPLVNLTRLLYFNASKFSLPGSIPEWFGLRLFKLQVLDLSSCGISGVVPVTFGNLTSLRSLNLSGNSLTGSIPSSLGQLSNLAELDLSMNSLTGSVPSSFSSLRNLSSLDLSSNYIMGPISPSIGTLLKLQSLNFSNNSFSSSIPPHLGNLTNLVELDLSLNALSGSLPPDLRRLRNLQKMFIGDNFLSGSLPAELFSVVPSQLQIISFRRNSFTGSLPDTLWSLPELRILDISNNNFTGMLPNSSLSANLSVGELNITQNMFYGAITPVTRRFQMIDLSGNYFEGKVPDYVNTDNASLISNCLQNVRDQRLSAECASFYTEKGLVFDNFGQPNSTELPEKKSSSGLSHRNKVILAAVAGGIGFILIFLLLPILVILCMRKRNRSQRGNGVGPSQAGQTPQPTLGKLSIDFSCVGDSFTYQQLLRATNEFNELNLIKSGHSGDIFNGFLENGIPIVVKRIDLMKHKNEGYSSELDLFSKVSHQRLVPLLGHCLESENKKFLVYKYMRNGDLGSSLFKKFDKVEDDGLQSLDWITRLKIALGAAEGLSYLHHECSPPLVHRDVQASSILLDDKFEVRLGSLSKVCAQESDSHQGRISRFLRLPESSDQGASGSPTTATCAHDVYCFGKVLLELVTGKLGVSSPNNAQTEEHLDKILPYISTHEKEPIAKILDPSLIVDEDLLEEVWAMAIIAKSCLNPKPSRRPLMRHIFNALENPLKVVREDHSGSGQLRVNSSKGVFGSWGRSSSDATVVSQGNKEEVGTSGLRKSGSQGSCQNENSLSRRRQSKEIVPEPPYVGAL